MKPAPFGYVRAGSLDEALAALAEGGEDAKPIAGGQSLVPALNLRLVRPTLLVDLNHAGLDGTAANGTLTVGATTRQAALVGDERVHPLVREALPFVGHFVKGHRIIRDADARSVLEEYRHDDPLVVHVNAVAAAKIDQLILVGVLAADDGVLPRDERAVLEPDRIFTRPPDRRRAGDRHFERLTTGGLNVKFGSHFLG